jgi:hypothetical protein
LNGLAYYHYVYTHDLDSPEIELALENATIVAANTGSPRHGYISATVPLFNEELLRVEYGLEDDDDDDDDDGLPTTTTTATGNSSIYNNDYNGNDNDNDDDDIDLYEWLETNMNPHIFFPKILVAPLYSSDASNPGPVYTEQILEAASHIQANFIVLILNNHMDWKARLRYWWNHEIPDFDIPQYNNNDDNGDNDEDDHDPNKGKGKRYYILAVSYQAKGTFIKQANKHGMVWYGSYI